MKMVNTIIHNMMKWHLIPDNVDFLGLMEWGILRNQDKKYNLKVKNTFIWSLASYTE